MIWFACPKCAKVHGRPENAIGAMIFCDCGNGLTVPWESTAPEPAHPPALAAPGGTRLGEPLNFGEPARPGPPPDATPLPRPRRGARYQVDPNQCFNHESRKKQKNCEECGLPFCDNCVVTFRGQVVCGPCKNYEARLLQRPPQTSSLAHVSWLLALGAASLSFCLFSAAGKPGYAWVVLIALLPQLGAMAAGLFALWKTKADPRVGGQALAVTGIVTASFAAILTIALTIAAGHVTT